MINKKELAHLKFELRGGIVCRLSDLRCKPVINIKDGRKLGYICDIEFEVRTGKICAIIVPGCSGFLGLFGKGEDYIIPYDQIEKIGDDVILVCYDIPLYIKNKKLF